MKTKLILFITIGLIGLISYSVSFACGDGHYDNSTCSSEQNTSDNFESSCQCTDRGYRYNDCISKSDYCEAFGNVGAR